MPHGRGHPHVPRAAVARPDAAASNLAVSGQLRDIEQGVDVPDGVQRVLLELDLGDVAALLDARLEFGRDLAELRTRRGLHVIYVKLHYAIVLIHIHIHMHIHIHKS